MNKNGEERKHALLFIMRVSLFQILITLSLTSFTFANNASGQEILDKKLSLNLPSKEIKTVLKTIAADMQIGFTYSNNTLPGKQKISVIANDERLGDVLARIFAPLNISYEVIGKQIVLKRNEPKELSQLLNTDADAFKNITGTVTGVDGAPLQGVSVSVAGTRRGTTTDDKGNFQIQANAGDVLVFSSVGFAEERIKVGESSSINISLK
jgi:iron complex outermembrane recepter protein